MRSFRQYVNRRAVRETLYFWIFLYIAGAAFFDHAASGAVFAAISCFPSYLTYRIVRRAFISLFPIASLRLRVH